MEILDKAKSTEAQQKKVEKVMREFKEGNLKSGSGAKVTSRDQAIAIALSEAGLSKVEKALETLGVYDLISDIYNKEIEIIKAQEIVKGKTLPVGTIKKRGPNNYIKTAQGWKYHSRANKGSSSKQTSEDVEGKSVKVGDNVQIGALPYDPLAKQGQYGKISKISDGGKTVHVQFGDGKVGKYSDGSFKLMSAQASKKKTEKPSEEEQIAVDIMDLSNSGKVPASKIARMRTLVNRGDLDAAYELIEQYKEHPIGKDEKESLRLIIDHSQSQNISAWASKILRTGKATGMDLPRIDQLGEEAIRSAKQDVAEMSDEDLSDAYGAHSSTQHTKATPLFKYLHKELLKREKDPKSKFYLGD